MNDRSQFADPPSDHECAQARTALESAPPDADDSPQIARARRHVERCANCREVLRNHRRLDLRIGAACREVPVPGSLRERLFSSLGLVDFSLVSGGQAARVEPGANSVLRHPAGVVRWARRRFVVSCLSAAASVAVAAGAWRLLAPRAPLLNLEELTLLAIDDQTTSESTREMSQLVGGRAPLLPTTMLIRPINAPPRELPGHDVAIYFFKVAGRGGAPVDARLVVVRTARLANRPAARRFLGGSPVYRGGGFCTTAWCEADFAYVCCVKGGENRLQRLLPARPVTI